MLASNCLYFAADFRAICCIVSINSLRIVKSLIWRMLLIQVLLSIFYISVNLIWNRTVLFSAIVGCIAVLIPNACFCFRMLKQSESNDAVHWLRCAYRSELGKWLMTGIIFLLAFTADHEWDPIILFAGYVLTQLSSWFLPFIMRGN